MHLIIIPLLIIFLLVGFYYAGDIWKGFNLSIPGIQDGKLQLPGSESKEQSPIPAPTSPLDTLR